MPAKAFLPDRVNSSPASPVGCARLKDSFCLKGFLLNAAYYLLQPEEACACGCVGVGVCVWGEKNHRIYQTSRLFWASYLVLIDEEEHDEQNLQEEDKQEQDEELQDTKGGKFNTAFI